MSMVVTYYIKLIHTGANKYNATLIFLFLVAETITVFESGNIIFSKSRKSSMLHFELCETMHFVVKYISAFNASAET